MCDRVRLTVDSRGLLLSFDIRRGTSQGQTFRFILDDRVCTKKGEFDVPTRTAPTNG